MKQQIIKSADPDNDTLAVYIILSSDKARAEIFASGVPANTILEKVDGGYASRDGKMRLQKRPPCRGSCDEWYLHKGK